MTIFYHSNVGFCVGKEFKGIMKYWNFNRKAWETYAVDSWEKELTNLIKKCYPEINLLKPKSLELIVSSP